MLIAGVMILILLAGGYRILGGNRPIGGADLQRLRRFSDELRREDTLPFP